MTQIEKRIKIAEECGYKELDPDPSIPLYNRLWISPKPFDGIVPLNRLPNYFDDLNAMYEAESILNNLDKEYSSRIQDYPSVMFDNELGKIVGVKYQIITTSDKPPLSTSIYASPFEVQKLRKATAAQRAEAFGLTLGLWSKED